MKPPITRPARDELTRRKAASPKPVRYQITWCNPISNDVVQIRIIHERNYFASGQDHLAIECVRPRKAPLPITDTGYLSHVMPALALINAGGPVAFVSAWIEREAQSKAWRARAIALAQGDLFQWAEAAKRTTTRPPVSARQSRDQTTEPLSRTGDAKPVPRRTTRGKTVKPTREP